MYKIISLDKHPELFPLAIELIEEAFGYHPPNRFDIDFYPLMSKDNRKNLYLLLEDDEITAHIGVLPRQIGIFEREFPVALIGGVAVAKNKQGQGYFHKLLENVFSRYTHYSGYFLWSDLIDLYQKYHFHQIGTVYPQAPKGFSPHCQKTLYRDLSAQDKRQIQKLHRQHTQNRISLIRQKKDWNDIARISSTDLYLKRNKQNKIIGYCFAHKGQDLNDIIHESVDIPDNEYPENLSCAHIWFPDPPTLSPPPHVLFTGLFRIGHPMLFQEFVAHITKQNIIVHDLDSTHLTIRFQKKTFKLTHKSFLTGLFGPNFIEEFRSFHVPLWFGGVDSV